jgi:hypothetical protein
MVCRRAADIASLCLIQVHVSSGTRFFLKQQVVINRGRASSNFVIKELPTFLLVFRDDSANLFVMVHLHAGPFFQSYSPPSLTIRIEVLLSLFQRFMQKLH